MVNLALMCVQARDLDRIGESYDYIFTVLFLGLVISQY